MAYVYGFVELLVAQCDYWLSDSHTGVAIVRSGSRGGSSGCHGWKSSSENFSLGLLGASSFLSHRKATRRPDDSWIVEICISTTSLARDLYRRPQRRASHPAPSARRGVRDSFAFANSFLSGPCGFGVFSLDSNLTTGDTMRVK